VNARRRADNAIENVKRRFMGASHLVRMFEGPIQRLDLGSGPSGSAVMAMTRRARPFRRPDAFNSHGVALHRQDRSAQTDVGLRQRCSTIGRGCPVQ